VSGLDRMSRMMRAFEFMFKSEVHGDYWEFGVDMGGSLARAHNCWKKYTEETTLLYWRVRSSCYA
jgi:hypothetical protein